MGETKVVGEAVDPDRAKQTENRRIRTEQEIETETELETDTENETEIESEMKVERETVKNTKAQGEMHCQQYH